MLTSFYTASTGAIQYQQGLDVVANNMANILTEGYKPQKANFSDLLYTNMQPGNTELKVGHGVKIDKTDILHTQGTPISTGRSLDFAVFDPSQYFGITTEDGIKYTKNGNFYLSAEGDKYYLTSISGGYVVDSKGQKIEIDPNKLDDLSSIDIGVFKFENIDGLQRGGDGFLIATPTSGNPNVVNNPELKQGYLEGSAVNVADEMNQVIQLQRAFQFNAKMVQISDEIMQTVNGLRQ